MLLCLTIATATDGLLPALGYQAPRLGVAAITLFAGTVAWGFQRYGYSVLSRQRGWATLQLPGGTDLDSAAAAIRGAIPPARTAPSAVQRSRPTITSASTP